MIKLTAKHRDYPEDRRRHSLLAGAILTGALVLIALTGVLWTPYSPTAMDGSCVMQSPSWLHWLGTDNYGRDVLSRIMAGSGTTFLVAMMTVAIGTVLGTLLGAAAGYFGGWIDWILSHVINVLLSFPSVLLSLILISFLGKGTVNIVTALGILFIPSFARIARSQVIQLKERDFVTGARAQGIREGRILMIHILPNLRDSLLSCVLIAFNNAVLAEAGLSYLGLGVQPPSASLGRMLAESQDFLASAPWCAMAAGAWVFLMILGFSLLSEGLPDNNEVTG